MPNADRCKYVAYRLSGSPIRAFGETYVITTAMTENAGVYRCEFYVVTTSAEPHLYDRALIFEPREVPEELLKVDVAFLVGEARQQAENYLYDRLSELAEENNRPNLLDYRVELFELPYMPLHGCWLRGKFVAETRAIAERTRCVELKRYLNLLVRSSFTRGPG